MSLPKPDYEKWRHVNTFTCLQAAYLWMDIEPQPETIDPPEYVKALYESLINEKKEIINEKGQFWTDEKSLKWARYELYDRHLEMHLQWDTDFGSASLEPLMPNFLDFVYNRSIIDTDKNKIESKETTPEDCIKHKEEIIAKFLEEDESISSITKKTLFIINYCLVHMLLNGFYNKEGKEIGSCFNSQEELALYIEDMFPLLKGNGNSLRTMKEAFAKANKIIKGN